jgi:hypothetical protein
MDQQGLVFEGYEDAVGETRERLISEVISGST